MRSITGILIIISVLCLSGQSQARIVDMQDYAVNDTVQAEEVMKWFGELGAEDTLWCAGLVIEGDITWRDTLKCMLKFGDTKKTTTFSGDVYFRSTTFSGDVHFVETTFSGEVSFHNTAFLGKTNFFNSTFSGEAKFWNVTFSELVFFLKVTFSELAFFERVTFLDRVYFAVSTFSGKVSFWEANFIKSPNFHNTKFDSKLYLSESNFQTTLDFRTSLFTDSARFFFDNLNFHQLLVNWNQWAGKIDSPDTTESRAESLKKNYILVESEFAKQGKHDDLDACYLERRKMERSFKSGFAWFGDWLLWFSCGYGVKPFYTIRLAGIMILLFALCYFKLGAIQERRFDVEERKFDIKNKRWSEKLLIKWRQFQDAFYFSVNTFTTVGYGDWYPTAKYLIKFKVKNREIGILRFRTLAMIEGLLGWLLLALFLVSLGRIWIR